MMKTPQSSGLGPPVLYFTSLAHLARPCGLRVSRSCALAWCTARRILGPRPCRAHHYARPRRPRAGGLSSPRPRPHAVSTGAARNGRFATAARPASARYVPLVRVSAAAGLGRSADARSGFPATPALSSMQAAAAATCAAPPAAHAAEKAREVLLTTSASGLKWGDIRPGVGNEFAPGQTVTIDYMMTKRAGTR